MDFLILVPQFLIQVFTIVVALVIYTKDFSKEDNQSAT
ncbi:Uncharacterised protein [Paenibacillus polymyxa]|uniref:Uncharacterized protein n=1 Tax=Paenibacillus polymyxa TaxID=1406 RepID=A0A378XWI3_PAEPO|nr:Uncharacterised protein [Paenibacillus polymyxa]